MWQECAHRRGLDDAFEGVDVQVVGVNIAGQPEHELKAEHVARHVGCLIETCKAVRSINSLLFLTLECQT